MIDTTDLTSYYPGYDEYCEPSETLKYYDNSDEYYDEMMIRKEQEEMERKVIDLRNITFKEAEKLENYVWTNGKLIPQEQLEGE